MFFRSLSLLASLAIASPAMAVTLDFEEFSHGDIVTSSQGVTITTDNIGGGPDLGVAFATTASVTADPDLELGGGWSGGNLAPDTELGNVLIIQEHRYSCDAARCDNPDDEGSRPAGSIAFDFSALGSFSDFSMDLVDVENVRAEPGQVVFRLGGAQVASVSFMDFLGDPAVAFGDHSANRVSVLSGVSFDHVTVHLGGSGGLDNVSAAVPEPSAALVFAIGALVVGSGVRRR